jgi:hypothetical protein
LNGLRILFRPGRKVRRRLRQSRKASKRLGKMRLSPRKVGREVLRRARRSRRLGLARYRKGRQLRRRNRPSAVLNKDRRKDNRRKDPGHKGEARRDNLPSGRLLPNSRSHSGNLPRLSRPRRAPSLRLRHHPRLPLLPGRCPKRRCKNLRRWKRRRDGSLPS